jgi:hypothetical protein
VRITEIYPNEVSQNENMTTKTRVLIGVTAVVLWCVFAASVRKLFSRALENARRNSCIGALALVDSAKDLYRMHYDVPTGTVVTSDDLASWIPSGEVERRRCRDGKPQVNPIGVEPTCSIETHRLDYKIGFRRTKSWLPFYTALLFILAVAASVVAAKRRGK